MGAENFVKTEAGQRSAKRARVLIAVRLKTAFGEIEARLRDLSRKGALVECARVPPAGSEVTFVRGKTVVPARVAWAADGRVGLEFLHMIEEHEVLVQLGKGAAAQDNDRYRLPPAAPRLTADQRKLASAWGVAVGINLPEHEG